MFQDGLLEGKRILITGGGTGLGKEMGARYMELGASLIICGRRKGVLDEAAAELEDKYGTACATYACDVRVAEAIDEMVEDIFQTGGLTGLVNNAAGNFISRTQDLSPRGFDAITNIVLHGTFYVTNSVGRRWIERGEKGNILSIVATYAWQGGPYTAPSASAKAGVVTLTKTLAVEWGPYGIRSNAIAPGAFPTEGMSSRLAPQAAQGSSGGGNMGAGNPMGRVGEMDELANLAVFLMADGVDYVNGETISIDGAGHHGQGFAGLRNMTDEDWDNIRGQIKATNDRDKAQRTV